MVVDIENNSKQQAPQTSEPSQLQEQNVSRRKVRKSSKKHGNDVKHVSRKLIMAWKLASEHPNITWKEISPIIDSVEFLSTHWKNDERLKSIEPVAVEIVSQVNKIHLELNLRVFGMNRLRIITEVFLNLLKSERDSFLEKLEEKSKEKETEAEANQEQSSEAGSGSSVPTNSSTSDNSKSEINLQESSVEKKVRHKHSHRSKEQLIDRLISSLSKLYDLLNEPAKNIPLSSATNSPKPSHTTITTPPQKHKSKKRNIFSGFFSSDKKQSSSNSSSTLNSPELSTTSIPSGLENYKNNIVSEWQEYTRKYVEPNYLFKVCKNYLAANPTAIPDKAKLIGQNWICVANEISMSLWNILKKREDDLASSLIFLTLYKHGSHEIIECAINTIGSQLPHHLYVRLEYALNIKEYEQLTKEEQQMLDSNYVPEDQQQSQQVKQITNSPKSDSTAKKTSSKNDKKKHNSGEKSESDDGEPLSFADMLAM